MPHGGDHVSLFSKSRTKRYTLEFHAAEQPTPTAARCAAPQNVAPTIPTIPKIFALTQTEVLYQNLARASP